MKISALSTFLLLMTACTVDFFDVNSGGETMTVSFEPVTCADTVSFGPVTRARFDDQEQTVWSKDDPVSVFYRQDVAEKWIYTGPDGSPSGTIVRSEVNSGNDIGKSVIVYPYNPDYVINPSDNTVISAFPSSQYYMENSFGEGGNIMIAASDDDNFVMKSIVGWLKLSLVGDKTIGKIILNGNDFDRDFLSGRMEINYDTLGVRLLPVDNSSNTGNVGTMVDRLCVTLYCGDGVALSSVPTDFYIALLPHTFEHGITIALKDTKGKLLMTKKTENRVEIKRRSILPFAELVVGNLP